MASRRSSVAPYEWKKTSVPTCYEDTSKGGWRLRLNFTKRKGEKATRKNGPLFDSREEALAGMTAFRMGWERSQRGKLWEPTEEDPIPSSAYAKADAAVPAGKSLNSLGKLNATQEQQFKRQRLDGANVTRADFVRGLMLSSRERRSIARGWSKRDRKLQRAFDKRGSYLGNRIYELSTTLATHTQDISRIENALLHNDVVSLLAPPPRPPVADDAAADEGARAEDDGDALKEEVSDAQRSRLWAQGYLALTVLKAVKERDLKQLDLVQRAKALSDKRYDTDKALKAADAERFELLNEASLLRYNSSLLQIGEKVRADGTEVYAASTILRWVRQFRSLGGFKRDSRGVHERDWIMSEEDLRQQLVMWMRSQKRLTVHDVQTYINGTLLADDARDLKRLLSYQVRIPISSSTTYQWMVRLGCKFERVTKSYYTDTHEKEEVVKYRDEYLKTRRKLALRQPLWVQVKRDTLKSVELERLRKEACTEEGFYAEIYEYEVRGCACIEFHVDLLRENRSVDDFESLRATLGPEGGHYSVRFEAAGAERCQYDHPPDKCKCKKEALHTGQDESCYKAYAREGMEWVIQGVRGLRKKTEGPGEMVSAFQDEEYGFGLPLTDDQLKGVNEVRKAQGKRPLTRSPGLRFLEYGKNKDGYWGYDQFEEQLVDVMDTYEYLAPDKQIIFEVDHSSGHAKHREDGLHVSNMNVKYGGKQKVLRDSVMTEACLGPEEAKIYFARGKWSTEFSVGALVIDQKLKVGETQSSTFAVGAPPPFYDWEAPRKDTTVVPKPKRNKKTGAVGDGNEVAAGGVSKPKEKIKEGYEGKPKGEKQYLWERGWWKDGMTAAAGASDDKNIEKVLEALPDFKNEKTALQHVVESRGHVLLMSPKCHPELAGVGIEYSWGYSKQRFRRVYNDEVPKHLHANIEKSMCTKNHLTIQRVRNFARRTRDYCRAYFDIMVRGVVVRGKDVVEKIRAKQKAHRNILDMEPGFLGAQE